MTQQEAIKALNEGKKVRHRYFTYDEYIYVDENGYLHDEAGFVVGYEFWELRKGEAWQKDWSIVN